MNRSNRCLGLRLHYNIINRYVCPRLILLANDYSIKDGFITVFIMDRAGLLVKMYILSVSMEQMLAEKMWCKQSTPLLKGECIREPQVVHWRLPISTGVTNCFACSLHNYIIFIISIILGTPLHTLGDNLSWYSSNFVIRIKSTAPHTSAASKSAPRLPTISKCEPADSWSAARLTSQYCAGEREQL